MGVAHATLSPARPIAPANVQAGARAARYAALSRWAAEAGVMAVATGHQMDDQAETLALRLVRGSGPHGLAGVRERVEMRFADAPPLVVIRPCLSLRRTDLRAIVDAAGWTAVADPTNVDQRYDRVRMRRRLPAEAVPGLARSARALAELEPALHWAEERAVDLALRGRGDELTLTPGDLPDALVRAVVSCAIGRLRPGAEPVRGPELDRLLSALHLGRGATLRGLQFVPGESWAIRTAPPERPHDCKPPPTPYLHQTPPASDPDA